MKNILLASTSTLYGQDYLAYLLNEITTLFRNCREIIFIPYARPGGISHEDYTAIVQKAFSAMPFGVKGLHEFAHPEEALQKAEGVFTGGGNTFLLVSSLYENKLMTALRNRIFEGLPYLGTSAGTNIAGPSMQTTNDMPIVYPPSFKTLGVVPFNINPHYLDPDVKSKHKGETRETRIKEFHKLNSQPVIGLREGSWLEVKADKITLKGPLPARIFQADKVPFEMETNSELQHLR